MKNLNEQKLATVYSSLVRTIIPRDHTLFLLISLELNLIRGPVEATIGKIFTVESALTATAQLYSMMVLCVLIVPNIDISGF
jgi:hypothetical protein